jgi:hypothetical protein
MFSPHICYIIIIIYTPDVFLCHSIVREKPIKVLIVVIKLYVFIRSLDSEGIIWLIDKPNQKVYTVNQT